MKHGYFDKIKESLKDFLFPLFYFFGFCNLNKKNICSEYSNTPTVDRFEKFLENIEWWGGKEKTNLIAGATVVEQFTKLTEEAGELSENINKSRPIKDDIGDVLVVLTILTNQLENIIDSVRNHSNYSKSIKKIPPNFTMKLNRIYEKEHLQTTSNTSRIYFEKLLTVGDETFIFKKRWTEESKKNLLTINRAELIDLYYNIGLLGNCFSSYGAYHTTDLDLDTAITIKFYVNEILIILSRLALFNNLTLVDCAEYSYEEIKDRRGVMFDGMFIKSTDPEYENARKIIQATNGARRIHVQN